MSRKICLDTETTGISIRDGDRVFDIGCFELINDIQTGKTFQCYLNPERIIPAEVEALCNVKNEDFFDKPKFKDMVEDFLSFIEDSPIIAHNANFDIGFLNNELKLIGREILKNEAIDTLKMARDKFPGQKASLDTLCKRFNIDNSNRKYHGALIDADLCAKVYLELIGGAEQKLIENKDANEICCNFANILEMAKNSEILPSRKFKINDEEQKKHEEFIMNKIKNSLWETLLE